MEENHKEFPKNETIEKLIVIGAWLTIVWFLLLIEVGALLYFYKFDKALIFLIISFPFGVLHRNHNRTYAQIEMCYMMGREQYLKNNPSKKRGKERFLKSIIIFSSLIYLVYLAIVLASKL